MKEPSSVLKISGFTNDNWGWRHQIPNQLPIGFTEQILHLIKSLQYYMQLEKYLVGQYNYCTEKRKKDTFYWDSEGCALVAT